MKKIFSVFFIVCFIIGILFCAPTVSAADVNKGIVEVSTVNANVGEEVVVPVLINENPGIMAITISITYQPDALEYVGFYYGNVFNDYTVAAHPDRKLVRVVICETRNKTKNGKIISLRFKVTKEAKAELSPITVEYNRGDFCNWNLDKIMPKVVSGGVEVAFNGENCPHKKYGEWSVVTEPVCKKVGVKVRICDFCGHNDYKEIDPIGHTYSENWTVDKPATEESDGTMSRYCIRCDDYVDRITFSLEQSEKEEIKNDIWEDFLDNETAEDIFIEQNPGKKPTQNSSDKNSSKDKNESSSKPSKDSNSSKDKTSSSSKDKDKNKNETSSKPNNSSENSSDKNDKTSNSSSKNESNDKNSQNASDEVASENVTSDNQAQDTVSDKENADQSKPSDSSQIIQEEPNTSSKEDVLEQILPEIENDEGEKISIYQKLKETFSGFEKIVKISRVLIIILFIIIIL